MSGSGRGKAANSAASRKVASSPTEADALPFFRTLSVRLWRRLNCTKLDSQTAALREEIVSIRQELHTTVSSLQSANAQCAKRVDDLEQATTEWTSTAMSLETTVKHL